MKHWKTLVCGVLAGLMLVPSAFAASTTPPDVQGHWAQESIERAVADGWVNGYPDGTFRPNATITRAEFVKMVLDAMDLTPGSDYATWLEESCVTVSKDGPLVPYQPKAFLDMGSNWLTKQGWMDVAVAFGLVVPADYSDNNFRPSKAITRYEIAVMLDRAMGKVYATEQPLTEALPFTDADQIPEWVQSYVNEAVKAGVLTGYPDGTFGHKKSATRAEAVAMVQRMLDYTRGEEVDPELKLTIRYVPYSWSSELTTEATTDKVHMQVVDNVLYASLYDILKVQEQLMTKSMDLYWQPVWQQLFAEMELSNNYRAGVRSFYIWWRNPKLTDDFYTGHFRHPTRMMNGQIMVPIYDYSIDYSSVPRWVWEADWDAATKTMTLIVDNEEDIHRS